MMAYGDRRYVDDVLAELEARLVKARRRLDDMRRNGNDPCTVGMGRMNAEEVRAAVDEAITYVRRWYDESIFPPRPKGPHTEVYDGEAAAVARLTCDNIRREFAERLADGR